jgi:Alcohol dehydrogenase GroES-like domain
MTEFHALVAHEDGEGGIVCRPEVVDEAFIEREGDEGAVTIAVEYSSINYKDALAVTPKAGVARSYPLIPGIDIAGTVTASSSPDFAVGDAVVAHGNDIGTGRHGGYAQVARLPADYLVKLDGLSTAQAAAISGPAGSPDLPTTVHPFILRGVTLAGIDSVLLPIAGRRQVWGHLESDLRPAHLDRITRDVSVLEVPGVLKTILGGGVTGRTRVVVRDGF